jgi:hypothetical protein
MTEFSKIAFNVHYSIHCKIEPKLTSISHFLSLCHLHCFSFGASVVVGVVVVVVVVVVEVVDVEVEVDVVVGCEFEPFK